MRFLRPSSGKLDSPEGRREECIKWKLKRFPLDMSKKQHRGDDLFLLFPDHAEGTSTDSDLNFVFSPVRT